MIASEPTTLLDLQYLAISDFFNSITIFTTKTPLITPYFSHFRQSLRNDELDCLPNHPFVLNNLLSTPKIVIKSLARATSKNPVKESRLTVYASGGGDKVLKLNSCVQWSTLLQLHITLVRQNSSRSLKSCVRN